MVKTNHVFIQNISPFPICLNSSQLAIINQKWKMLADILEDESLLLTKKADRVKENSGNFPVCEKEIAKLYTATSSRLNTSILNLTEIF